MLVRMSQISRSRIPEYENRNAGQYVYGNVEVECYEIRDSSLGSQIDIQRKDFNILRWVYYHAVEQCSCPIRCDIDRCRFRTEVS